MNSAFDEMVSINWPKLWKEIGVNIPHRTDCDGGHALVFIQGA